MTHHGSFTLRRARGPALLMRHQPAGLLQPSKGATSTEQGHLRLEGSQLTACITLHCEVHLVLLRAIMTLVDVRERLRCRERDGGGCLETF